MLKKNSSMWTMYFKLKLHRNTILIGNAAIERIRTANTMYRAKPIFTKKFRKIVLANSGGKMAMYRMIARKPGISRTYHFVGLPMPSQLIQTISDKSTLL